MKRGGIMSKIPKILGKYLFLFGIGGFIYALIEIMFRGHTHWTMMILGGICFIAIGLINEFLSWDIPLIAQGIIGSVAITSLEFITGCIVNLKLGWNVWDYSDVLFNVKGQICLPFSVLWVFISVAAIILDDYLRYWIFHEEKPHYTIV